MARIRAIKDVQGSGRVGVNMFLDVGGALGLLPKMARRRPWHGDRVTGWSLAGCKFGVRERKNNFSEPGSWQL
jgi:hypothetical protein